jgi:hypothetical protein
MAQTTKSRPIVTGFGKSRLVITDKNLQTKVSSVQSDIQGSAAKYIGWQSTASEGHPFRSSKQKGRTDLGGDFSTTKEFATPIGFQSLLLKRYFTVFYDYERTIKYTGPVLAVEPNSVTWPSNPASSDSQINAMGTTAIAAVKPTNPVASLTVALGEILHEGIPAVSGVHSWKDRTQVARDAGDEYLNIQFGWRPLVNDVISFGYGVTNAHDVIETYKRGVGRPVKKSYKFPVEESTTTQVVGTNVLPYVTPGNSELFRTVDGAHGGTLIKEITLRKDRWFEGAFTYFIPQNFLGKKMGDYAILAQQLGLDLTPDTLWNLAPWSWAVDWISNAGDVISNYADFHQHGLVMIYGYMMEHTIVTHNYRLLGAAYTGGVPCSPTEVSLIFESKIRRGATPYGFGLNYGGFSIFQQSILAALGLSKGRR